MPSFASDNLYKFMAMAGLVLAAYCAFFAYQQVWELQLQVVRTEAEEKVIRLESDAAQNEMDRISGTKEARGEGMREIRARVLASQIQRLRITGKKIEVDLLARQVTIHFILFWIGILGGLTMSAGGFYLWYIKIQKPSDRLIDMRLSAGDNSASKPPM